MSTVDATAVSLTLAQELSQLISKIAAKELDFYADEGIEVLHDFRVDLRKLRSWLQIIEIAGYPVKKLKKHAQHCHSIGGELRNFDVLLNWMKNNSTRVSPKLLSHLKCERKKLKKKFLKELIHKNVIPELRALGRDFLTQIKKVSANDFQPYVIRNIEKHKKSFNHILPKAADDLEKLHKIRKILKKIRYSLPLLSAINIKYQNTLKELQDILGYINDRRVWIDIIRSEFRNVEGAAALEEIFKQELNDKVSEFKIYNSSEKEYF